LKRLKIKTLTVRQRRQDNGALLHILHKQGLSYLSRNPAASVKVGIRLKSKSGSVVCMCWRPHLMSAMWRHLRLFDWCDDDDDAAAADADDDDDDNNVILKSSCLNTCLLMIC